MFTKEEKKAIIVGKVLGKSNRELVFDLFSVSGRQTDAYALGKVISTNESVQDGISQVASYVEQNIDHIVNIEDDTE